MSEVKNKKKKSSIIQVSIGVLAVIMACLLYTSPSPRDS